MLLPPALDGATMVDTDDWQAPAHYGDPAAEYWAARNGAVVMDRGHEGRVRASGRDRLDLLHRMSTNDLTNMAVGEARPTVLTTAVGRMVDLLWVLNLGDTVLMLTGPGQTENVRRWLSSYVFFSDDVRFDDAGDELGRLGVFGPEAGRVVEAVAPGAADLNENRFLQADGLVVLRSPTPGVGRPLAGEAFTLVGPGERLSRVWESLVGAGAVPSGEETFQVLRVEAGQAYGGHEVGEAFIPLEAGLWPAVSFTKGCYIGQEIIARMESRGKLAKTLVGLRLSAPVVPGTGVRLQERRVGQISSAVVSPAVGPIALAFVKPDAAAPGTTLTAGEVDAEVTAFPIH